MQKALVAVIVLVGGIIEFKNHWYGHLLSLYDVKSIGGTRWVMASE